MRTREALLAWVLRLGVALAALLLTLGGLGHVGFLGLGPRLAEGLAWAGLYVLVLTPVTRVALATFLFATEGDWTFVGITLFVLMVLLLSLLGLLT
ncbi:DUF1634 domain-containing protein [Thermus thalpophilus]|uniref:DUF1634 domain-containing protein n=1 Tax=Thermus thalpophilus TaxID=2908147 RepID=UPI00311AB802